MRIIAENSNDDARSERLNLRAIFVTQLPKLVVFQVHVVNVASLRSILVEHKRAHLQRQEASSLCILLPSSL